MVLRVPASLVLRFPMVTAEKVTVVALVLDLKRLEDFL
jgi:hypothetical protein